MLVDVSCGLLVPSFWPESPMEGFCNSAATTLPVGCGLLAPSCGLLAPSFWPESPIEEFCAFAATTLLIRCWPEMPGDGFCNSAATALPSPQPGAAVPRSPQPGVLRLTPRGQAPVPQNCSRWRVQLFWKSCW